MSDELQLQAGGTLNSRRHLYIERQEDEKFFELLEQGEYVNVLSSRQMGKSSLMMRAVRRLSERRIKSVTIDLASELGSPPDLNAFYLGLLNKIVRILALQIDLKMWWDERGTETINQRLLRFFREIVGGTIAEPVVIFLDEIDSTLRLPYTDDLFTAIRGMYNDRPMVEAYRRITFCLLGVATPNELIKDRRTTAYNVGTPLTLRDFERGIDNLSPLAAVLDPDTEVSNRLLDRILYWSGGQPYLTQKLCLDVVANRISIDTIDEFVAHAYENLGQASNDVHFQQILRFLEDRLSDENATIELYAKVLEGAGVPDRTTLANAELKLSGLVKRDNQGNLIVRNPIYRRLFDNVWVKGTRPRRALSRTRRYAIAASVAFLLLLGGGAGYYVNVIQPNQSRLAVLDRLAALKISVTDAVEGVRVTFPNRATPELIREAIPILKGIGPVTEIDYGAEPQDEKGRKGFTGEMLDLSPLAELDQLRRLDIAGLTISSIAPLARLSRLENLKIGPYSGSGLLKRDLQPDPLESIAALSDLKFLERLSVGGTRISDLRPLSSAKRLRYIDISHTDVTDLRPLAKLGALQTVIASFTRIQDLEPLSNHISLQDLRISFTQVSDLSPLSELVDLFELSLEGTKVNNLSPLSRLISLEILDLSDTNVDSVSPLSELVKMQLLYLDGTRVADVKPLAGLTNLDVLWLDRTGVVNVAPLATLKNLTDLRLSETQVRDALPLQALGKLENLNLRGTRVPREQLKTLRLKLDRATITSDDPSIDSKPLRSRDDSRERSSPPSAAN